MPASHRAPPAYAVGLPVRCGNVPFGGLQSRHDVQMCAKTQYLEQRVPVLCQHLRCADRVEAHGVRLIQFRVVGSLGVARRQAVPQCAAGPLTSLLRLMSALPAHHTNTRVCRSAEQIAGSWRQCDLCQQPLNDASAQLIAGGLQLSPAYCEQNMLYDLKKSVDARRTSR